MYSSEYKFKIRSYDCDNKGKLKLTNVMLFLQEAAYLNAKKLKLGFEDMQRENKVWVLSNVYMLIYKLPEWNDEIIVKTWPTGYNRLLANRDFTIKIGADEPAVRVLSDWLNIDIKSRKPVSLTELNFTIPVMEERAVEKQISRLNPKSIVEYEKLTELVIPFSALDVNGHVNNSEYIKWSFDAYISAKGMIEDLTEFQITFISEIFMNEKLEIFTAEYDEKKFIFGKKKEKNEYVFALSFR